MGRKRAKEWKIHEKATKLFSFKPICYLRFSKKTKDKPFIAIIRDYWRKSTPLPHQPSRVRVSRAHITGILHFLLSQPSHKGGRLSQLWNENQGDKRKNVGEFLEKVQRFSENLPRFLEKVQCFWRKVREAFSENSFYGSQCIESPFEIIGNFFDSSDFMR